MGEVWKAFHPRLERSVAIKLILPEVVERPQVRAAFLREVQNLSKLHAPQTLQVLDFGLSDRDEPYMVTEFLEGEDLASRLRREGLIPVEETIFIGVEILKSLSEAHAHSIVHRDLKPGNIFLQELRSLSGSRFGVKVLDFGVAKVLSTQDNDPEATLWPDVALKGSPRYMAPEQIQGERILPQTDLYALGGILYLMLVGEPVFPGKHRKVLLAHLNEKPRSLQERAVISIPEPLEQLVLRCLSKEPLQRPKSAEVMRAELESILRSLESEEQVEMEDSGEWESSVTLRVEPAWDKALEQLQVIHSPVPLSDTITPASAPSPYSGLKPEDLEPSSAHINPEAQASLPETLKILRPDEIKNPEVQANLPETLKILRPDEIKNPEAQVSPPEAPGILRLDEIKTIEGESSQARLQETQEVPNAQFSAESLFGEISGLSSPFGSMSSLAGLPSRGKPPPVSTPPNKEQLKQPLDVGASLGLLEPSPVQIFDEASLELKRPLKDKPPQGAEASPPEVVKLGLAMGFETQEPSSAQALLEESPKSEVPVLDNTRVSSARMQPSKGPLLSQHQWIGLGALAFLILLWSLRLPIAEGLSLDPSSSLGRLLGMSPQITFAPQKLSPRKLFNERSLLPKQVKPVEQRPAVVNNIIPRGRTVMLKSRVAAKFTRLDSKELICEEATRCEVPIDINIKVEKKGYETLLLHGDDLYDRRGRSWKIWMRKR